MESKYIKRAENCIQNEQQAVQDLAGKLRQDDMDGVIFFCSADYDLTKLEDALNENFACPVVGCTTAGEIASTYQKGGIVGVSFSSEVFRFHSVAIDPFKELNLCEAKKIVSRMQGKLSFADKLDPQKMFGLLLIDGLSMKEELTTATLHNALDGVALIGGSAGDSLTFTETKVFVDGKFHSNAAAFTLIESLLPFKTFKFQHCEPSDKDMVITESDPSKRIVYEIDGGPAALELAEIIGIKKEELTMEVYSTHPVMLQIGKEWYIRSIQRCNEDDSLTFACAIDSGIPLTVGEAKGLASTLNGQVDQLLDEFKTIEATLGFDCIHRRLEIMETGLQEKVEGLLGKINFVGFSTYGEQFNSIHVNQTLTGIVIGSK